MNVKMTLSGQEFSLSDTPDKELIEMTLVREIERQFAEHPSVTIKLKKTRSAFHGEIIDAAGMNIGHAIIAADIGSSGRYCKVIRA